MWARCRCLARIIQKILGLPARVLFGTRNTAWRVRCGLVCLHVCIEIDSVDDRAHTPWGSGRERVRRQATTSTTFIVLTLIVTLTLSTAALCYQHTAVPAPLFEAQRRRPPGLRVGFPAPW